MTIQRLIFYSSTKRMRDYTSTQKPTMKTVANNIVKRRSKQASSLKQTNNKLDRRSYTFDGTSINHCKTVYKTYKTKQK